MEIAGDVRVLYRMARAAEVLIKDRLRWTDGVLRQIPPCGRVQDLIGGWIKAGIALMSTQVETPGIGAPGSGKKLLVLLLGGARKVPLVLVGKAADLPILDDLVYEFAMILKIGGLRRCIGEIKVENPRRKILESPLRSRGIEEILLGCTLG